MLRVVCCQEVPMDIQTYEDLETGDAVITLGPSFDMASGDEFSKAYSKFDPCGNFRIDFEPVQNVDPEAFGLLLGMRRWARGVDATITITGPDYQ